MSTYDLETAIQLLDEEDVDVRIEFEVTYWGSLGCGPSLTYPGDPPEPAEFAITEIVRADNGNAIAFDKLSDEYRQRVYELVAERVYEIEQDRGYEEDY